MASHKHSPALRTRSGGILGAALAAASTIRRHVPRISCVAVLAWAPPQVSQMLLTG